MGVTTGNPTWVDFPSTETPVRAENLNAIEDALDAVSASVPTALANSVVARVWTGTSYPPRVEGFSNLFVGGPFPGILMGPGDVWENGDATTLATVTSAAQNIASPLFAAIQSASVPQEIFIGVGDLMLIADSGLTRNIFGNSPNMHPAIELPTPGVPRTVGSCRVPDAWSRVHLVAYWYHDVATTGDVTWVGNSVPVITGGNGISGGVTSFYTTPTPLRNRVHRTQSASSHVVQGGHLLSFSVSRNSNAASDTLAGPVRLLGVGIARAS